MDNNLENEENALPTAAPSVAIKAIAKDTVHKICSGQVVVNLAVAVKELVENAIDAEATLVEVKLFNQGLESVEVVDNGSGVEAHNLESMTAKYHTSKLREFRDLQEIESFGFRGEALSSLCALSNMVIQTRPKSTNVGTKITLDCEGKIKQRTPCARAVGTTVTISNLFCTLPVRRRDFERNIKKEFSKMCQILQAYCLITKGVRIVCYNQSANGQKKVILQTHGALDMLANISAVFGPRQLADIVPFKACLKRSNNDKEDMSVTTDPDTSKTTAQLTDEHVNNVNQAHFQLEGFISSCSHGAGRSSKDRQFMFVNSRPCDLKNVAKIINEVYHQYNVQQYPFVCLNIIINRDDVDINLTPDKRQLLFNNEKSLILRLKNDLLNMFGNIPSNLKLHNVTISSVFDSSKKSLSEESSEICVPSSLPHGFMNMLTQWKSTGDTADKSSTATSKRKCSTDDEVTTHTQKLKKIDNFFKQEELLKNSYELNFDEKQNQNCSEETSKDVMKELNLLYSDKHEILNKLPKCITNSEKLKSTVKSPKNTHSGCELLASVEPNKICINIPTKSKTSSKDTISLLQNNFAFKESNISTLTKSAKNENEILSQSSDDSTVNVAVAVELDECDTLDKFTQNNSYGEMRTSLTAIEQNLHSEKFLQTRKKQITKLERLRFKSEIRPTQNQSAEAELQREILKDDFARMSIIGQFNLGFIIVKLDDDLFIVDQHASDEKYNFEMLEKTTRLEYQKLTVPQTLELTAVNEIILLDNISVFEKNGFKFEINEHGPTTKKIRLLGKPFSKNWQFGKDDIDELIFMLQDAPDGSICRPSRIRAMFASRACRKSVMVGTALNHKSMKSLITHMGEIEQPWNCPHGRPTLRHLININIIEDQNPSV